MKYVIFSSYGNDSIALIEWAKEKELTDVTVAYSDTGWAAENWPARVEKAEKWIESIGYNHVRLSSIGMLGLVDKKHAWPRGGGGKYQFCTDELKIRPAVRWLDQVDPDADTVCLVGIRREESPNRATFPEWTYDSPGHGKRDLWAPLVRHTRLQRNDLIWRSPFLPLPHKSRECSPCVNARKKEIAELPETKIRVIRQKEREMGINGNGNAIVMFSPRRSGGAVGIDAVRAWASDGKIPEPLAPSECDSGWCGG